MVLSLCQEDPLEKGMATPVFLPGEFHGQRSLAGYSPWDRKELDTAEQLTLPGLAGKGVWTVCPSMVLVEKHIDWVTICPRSCESGFNKLRTILSHNSKDTFSSKGAPRYVEYLKNNNNNKNQKQCVHCQEALNQVSLSHQIKYWRSKQEIFL